MTTNNTETKVTINMGANVSSKLKIRNLISGIYDIQKLRIATGNRVVQSFNIQMGQKPSTKQEDMDKEANKLIEQLRNDYRRITDAYVDKQYAELEDRNGTNIKGKTKIEKSAAKKDESGAVKQTKVITFAKNASINKIIEEMSSNDNSGVNVIKSKLDYELVGTYVDLLDTEENMIKILSKEVEAHPLWDAFFADIKGCGPLMAAVCIAYLDPYKARHVSSFWKYVGLDTVNVVNEDGTQKSEGRSMKHVEEFEYIDKDGNTKTKRGITYNPVVKTKLVGVLGSCLLKAGLRTLKDENGNPILDSDGNKQRTYNTKYAQIYGDYYNRLNQRNDTKEYTDIHKHNMANRYMIKQFLRDLWVEWRTIEGLSVDKPYEVEKLGNKPHKWNEAQVKAAM